MIEASGDSHTRLSVCDSQVGMALKKWGVQTPHCVFSDLPAIALMPFVLIPIGNISV